MIEINLLPEEQKVKTRKAVVPVGQGIDPTYLVYIVPVAAVILLFVHIYLGYSFSIQQIRSNKLNKEWVAFEGQRQKIGSFKAESESSSQDAQVIDELVNKSIHWARKLNLLSLNLPPGLWFNDITINRKNLEIKASVFSLESNGLDIINKFLFNLKSDLGFFKSFSSLETGNMQTKKIGSYEVMDFTIIGVLKSAK